MPAPAPPGGRGGPGGGGGGGGAGGGGRVGRRVGSGCDVRVVGLGDGDRGVRWRRRLRRRVDEDGLLGRRSKRRDQRRDRCGVVDRRIGGGGGGVVDGRTGGCG